MAHPATLASQRIRDLLTHPSGLSYQVARLTGTAYDEQAGLPATPIGGHNAPPDLLEKAGAIRYPNLVVYCDRVNNTLREKFRTFSGTARMVVEVRVSQDRLEGLDQQIRVYTEAVLAVLDGNRGDLGSGMFYSGAYEVTYGSVKPGGKNLLQTAKIAFEIEMSQS